MRTSSLPRRLFGAVVVLGLLASCGGSDPESTAASQDGDHRQKALGLVPPTTPIPADAHLKGLFGAVQAWPLIAVHGVLTSDGRVLSYGSRGDGLQTGNFIYDVWNPADGSHLTLPNATGTDIFCSSQIMLPSGAAVVLNGGDNWTGSATTNGPNNNSNVFDVATRSLTRANNMNQIGRASCRERV